MRTFLALSENKEVLIFVWVLGGYVSTGIKLDDLFSCFIASFRLAASLTLEIEMCARHSQHFTDSLFVGCLKAGQ